MGVNYTDTFIAASPDSRTDRGIFPARPGSIAAVQFQLMHDHPYRYDSEDVLFLVHALRHGIDEAEFAGARREFFSAPKACLRCSPLVKTYGWGIHHNEQSRVAIYPVESAHYEAMRNDPALTQIAGMRNSRR